MSKMDVELTDVWVHCCWGDVLLMGMAQEQLAVLLKRVNTKDSGRYNFDEFWKLMKKLKKDGHWLL